MIFVQRPPPPFDLSQFGGTARRRIAEYYALSPEHQQQTRLDIGDNTRRFYARMLPEVSRVFHGKCAYCETSIFSPASGDVETFRPRLGATDLEGRGSLPHYGWLALEWENLYLACINCNRAKRNLFPVVGERAPPLTPVAQLGSETAQLIDPCREDPSEHLDFSDVGLVRPLSGRGDVTIKVLSLNRSELVARRTSHWSRLAIDLDLAERRPHEAPPVDPAKLRPEAEFAAVTRAFARLHAEQIDKILEQTDGAHELPAASRQRASETSHTFIAKASSDEESARLNARPLRRIQIRNFKMLRDFDLQLAEPRDGAPWLVLLGENATGKSSALLATALALAGADAANRFLRPADVLNRDAEDGEVRLEFWDETAPPAVLSYSRGLESFTGTPQPSALVLAYGALRVPGVSRRRPEASPHAHIRGITQTVSRLPNPQPWLKKLDKDAFATVGRVLKTLLLIPGDESLMCKRRREIVFGIDGDATPLDELSAGYRGMVGIAADVLQVLFTRWSIPESAEGFVIIDELESHLHPRWKMRVVKALRTAFPHVQFLVSTHDPLLLRGVRDNEVRLMRRDPVRGASADDRLPSIEGLRVDQLLTSEFFGLFSAQDPDLELLFREYYDLLSIRTPTTEQAERIGALRAQLDGKHQMGSNSRERLMLEAIDKFLANNKPDTPLDSDTSAYLQSVWAQP